MLPDGEIVIPLERDGEFVWAVHPDHITPELCEALNRYTSHITRHGLWQQQWDGTQQQPPHHHQQRQAS